MDRKIQTILQDIYQIDPNLKNHEQQLINIIQKLITEKPDTKFDQQFTQRLWSELSKQIPERQSGVKTLIDFMSFKKMAYAVGGILILIVLAYPTFTTLEKNKNLADRGLEIFGDSLQIEMIGQNAFGNLTTESQASDQIKPTSSTERSSATPAGLGGGGLAALDQSQTKMVAPDYSTNYIYVYRGQPIELSEEKMEVLKRNKYSRDNSNINSLLKSFNLGLIDLSSFSGGYLQSITINQEQPFGYNISANLDEGMIWVGQNWATWPQSKCQDVKCWEAQRLQINEVPGDEEIIKIADDFLKDHKISTKNYGKAYIDNQWRILYERAIDKTSVYIPDQMVVIYPLEINGKQTFEAGGYPIGINVNVDIKNKKVTAVGNLTTNRYQSSFYEAETNFDRILKVAENGGLNSYHFENPSQNIEIEIGEPKMIWMKKYNYHDGFNDELLVPALAFPITKIPDGVDLYQKNIIVPLIKEVLDEGNTDGPIRIMPTPLEKSVK
ncbi:MAG: hypothetical protein M1338_04155 [Patescibacteria group bacterium]|nr:hypothetical protein [Patescibacteria group bacterium]